MFDNVFQLNFVIAVLVFCFVTVIGVNILTRLVSLVLSLYVWAKKL